ncbi:MAG: AsnC family transcriptional regulator, partial [Mesorhizobium sp.]
MPLDRIDIAILETLQKDGRIPNAALAEKVG